MIIKKSLYSLFIFFIVALFLRLPFFFVDAINHDESTFILVGQHLADGHLPYYQLWDLKPIGIFYYFASILWLFGKKLWLIRFSGVIIVALSAWVVQKISFKFLSDKGAFFSGILTIFLFSAFGAVQCVLSEHIGILPFLIGFYFLLKPIDYKNAIIIGICFGLSFICRLNLAYPIVFTVATSILINKDFLSLKKFSQYALMTFSSVVIIFVSILPYILKDDITYIYKTTIEASLAYATLDYNKFINMLPSLIIFSSLTIFFAIKSIRKKELNKNKILLLSALVSMIFMLIKGGKINGHYLLQIYPFLAIIFIYIIEHSISIANNIANNIAYNKTKPWIIGFFTLAAAESYYQYYNLLVHKLDHNSWYMGDSFETTNWLKQNDPNEKNLFFMKHHLGYWLTNTLPPTPVVTHPTNINRDTCIPYIKSARKNKVEELNYILNVIQPKYIIEDNDYRDKIKDENNMFYQKYANYSEVYKTKKGVILKRF